MKLIQIQMKGTSKALQFKDWTWVSLVAYSEDYVAARSVYSRHDDGIIPDEVKTNQCRHSWC